jgi:hypothetical protein
VRSILSQADPSDFLTQCRMRISPKKSLCLPRGRSKGLRGVRAVAVPGLRFSETWRAFRPQSRKEDFTIPSSAHRVRQPSLSPSTASLPAVSIPRTLPINRKDGKSRSLWPRGRSGNWRRRGSCAFATKIFDMQLFRRPFRIHCTIEMPG